MPENALPEHLKGDVDEIWKNTDNSSWLMRLKKRVQYLLAAGPRVPSGFFKWREIPKTVFLRHGKGQLRYENSDGSVTMTGDAYNDMPEKQRKYFYLSRIQPWVRWHISINWPFFFNAHVIYKKKNVVEPMKYQSAFGIKKMFTFGAMFKRDSDKIYWLSANGFGNFE